ncbi:MAG: BamA/TamA family outer membrane protein, partial [Gammaproteobacteria bacterium]
RSIDELSRTIQFTYQDITQFTSYTSHFSTETLSGGLAWQYPISEVQYLNFGFVYQDAELVAGLFSSDQAKQWVRENGDPFVVGEDAFGTNVRALEITAGWTYDSRNASIFPTAGQRIRARLNATVPGSEVEYYTASLDFTKFMPLWGRWIFKINSELAYGDAFGETTALPPFRNRYAGGPGSVRGYKQSYLGPRDNFGRPYGGNLLFANQFELIVPTPQKFGNSARMGLFFDIGNVFSTGGVDFRDRLGDPIDYKFDYDRLKKSVGFAVEWLSPMGLLSFSYAYPLNADEDTDRFYGDPVENFQFNIGSAF